MRSRSRASGRARVGDLPRSASARGAVQRDPAGELALRVVARCRESSQMPASGRFQIAAGEVGELGEPLRPRPGQRVAVPDVVAGHVEDVAEVAELQLVLGAVAERHRPRAAVAVEVELLAGQPRVAVERYIGPQPRVRAARSCAAASPATRAPGRASRGAASPRASGWRRAARRSGSRSCAGRRCARAGPSWRRRRSRRSRRRPAGRGRARCARPRHAMARRTRAVCNQRRQRSPVASRLSSRWSRRASVSGSSSEGAQREHGRRALARLEAPGTASGRRSARVRPRRTTARRTGRVRARAAARRGAGPAGPALP